MNEHIDLERSVAGHIRGGSATPPSPAFYDELFTRAEHTRQRPRWLAIIKEPPMRIASRLAYGSPTARVAAIIMATLLLALTLAAAGIAGTRLLAADDTIVVAADGSGDFSTIVEAAAAAQDGETLMIRPGNYTDPFVINKDITLMGDGPREEIVIGGNQLPSGQDGCGSGNDCAFVLDRTAATLSGVTFRGDHAGLAIFGGAPTIEDVLFDQDGGEPDWSLPYYGVAVYVGDGSNARILGNEFIGASSLTIQDQSNPLVEGNIMRGWEIAAEWPGDDTVIRGNDIRDSSSEAIGMLAASTMLIEGNTLMDAGSNAIDIGFFSAQGYEPIIRGNTITGSVGSGISIGAGGAPTIEGNTLSDNRYGILLQVGDAVVRDNDIQGEGIGILVAGGGSPSIVDNDIDVTGRGISITRGSKSTLTGNTVCGGEESIFVDDESEPVIDDSNETCAEITSG